MLRDFVPPRKLIEPRSFRQFASGSGTAKIFIVVVAFAHDVLAGTLDAGLLGEVIEVYLAEGAVVKPVVSHPAVNHGTLRHRGFERGMRIDERHDDGKALV